MILIISILTLIACKGDEDKEQSIVDINVMDAKNTITATQETLTIERGSVIQVAPPAPESGLHPLFRLTGARQVGATAVQVTGSEAVVIVKWSIDYPPPPPFSYAQ